MEIPMNMEPGVLGQAHGYTFESEVDRNILQDLLPRLIPRLMEVFTDASVINEITQHKVNSGRNEQNITSMPICFGSSKQRSMYETINTSFDIENVNTGEGKLLEPLSLDADVPDETEGYISCSSSLSSGQRQNTWAQKKLPKNFKYKRIAYASIIAAASLLTIILAGILTILVLWLAVKSGSALTLDQLYNTCNDLLHVSVKSPDEYNTAFQKARNQKLSISIEIDRPNDWPAGVQIQSLNRINDIRINGPFHAKKLVGLLTTISNLERLHLDNKDNAICIESMSPIKTFDTGTIVNITVRQLVLERFNPSCGQAWQIIHDSVELNKLESFRFVSGNVSSTIVRSFETLLEKHTSTLKSLEIIDTSFQTQILFEKKSMSFNKVDKVALNTTQNDKNMTFIPLSNICSLFPNVQRLSFGSALIQWNEIQYIYNCKQLKSLQLKIWVKSSCNNFSLSFLADNFPYLQGAEVTLLFGTVFPSSDMDCIDEIKKVDGHRDLSNLLLANLRITSNCKLTF